MESTGQNSDYICIMIGGREIGSKLVLLQGQKHPLQEASISLDSGHTEVLLAEVTQDWAEHWWLGFNQPIQMGDCSPCCYYRMEREISGVSPSGPVVTHSNL